MLYFIRGLSLIFIFLIFLIYGGLGSWLRILGLWLSVCGAWGVGPGFFRGWGCLYKHSRITLRKKWCAENSNQIGLIKALATLRHFHKSSFLSELKFAEDTHLAQDYGQVARVVHENSNQYIPVSHVIGNLWGWWTWIWADEDWKFSIVFFPCVCGNDCNSDRLNQSQDLN